MNALRELEGQLLEIRNRVAGLVPQSDAQTVVQQIDEALKIVEKLLASVFVPIVE